MSRFLGSKVIWELTGEEGQVVDTLCLEGESAYEVKIEGLGVVLLGEDEIGD